uniref:Ig-like domain-containing protein n=1 Tax=Gadus morhua TaxID=8049 RepID=A0A8C4Z660_GADMO
MALLSLPTILNRGEFLDAPPDHALLSLAEKETVLPCRYRDDPGVKSTVVQVTWYKEGPGGSRDQIMAAHHQDGQTAFGPWSGRVRFQSSEPMVDSSLVILTTEVLDEGSYTCHISTFPAGNFDQKLTLTVWTVPISSLDPVILVEGQSYRLAAACRSVARPLPSLSWDTDLNGQSTNRSSDTGSVSSHYSLHPLRSMNGKKLDCLVSHQSLKKPRRLRNNVVVHYPPNAEVSGYSPNWFVGMETAMLHCRSGGNPMPEEFTWTRQGGDLPQGVIPHPNGTLEFGRPLSAGDGGVYQCVVRNVVDSSKATVELKPDNLLLIGVGGAAGGLLLLMLVVIVSVTCHHKRRNKKLERQLTDTPRDSRPECRTIPALPPPPAAPPTLCPLTGVSHRAPQDQALSRDSRSTLSGMLLDHLGRPSLTNGSRRGGSRILERDEEKRLRVESYARNSTMSLVRGPMHPPLLPSPVPVLHSTEILRTRQPHGTDDGGGGGGGRIANGTRNMQPPPPRCGYPTRGDEEDEEDEGLGGLMCPEVQGETHSSLMMDAPQVHFQQQAPQHHLTNGTLRPKSRSPLPNPHASHIHKAQIV